MKEILERIFREYGKAKEQEFASHPLADFIRNDIPELMSKAFPSLNEMVFDASPGQGRWADAPWIAMFDPSVTETAQEGYYPVLLFNQHLDMVYLSLNQGMTSLKDEVGYPQAREILRANAGLIRTRLAKEYKTRFSSDSIDLGATGSTDRLAMYEPGHALGKAYIKNNLPSENELILDFLEMADLYQKLKFLGGIDDVNAIHQVSEDPGEYSSDFSLEEKRRLTIHRRIERNQRLSAEAKKAHGFKCQVCGFDFYQAYGELGKDFIEAHHKIPLSELAPDKPAFLSPEMDFAVVCANCHRMIHRPEAPKTWEDFLAYYREIHR